MEQGLKKSLWNSIAGAHGQAWRKSIRWSLMLAISGSTLLALLVILGLLFILMAGDDFIQTRNLVLVVAAAGGLLLWLVCTIAIYICLDRLVLRRIEGMQKGAVQVNSGDFQYRIPIEQPDELGRVAEQINLLASGLDRREGQLVKAHEKALIDGHFKSDLLARVSHDLRQPLGVILGFSEMMRDEIVGPVTNHQRRAISEIISSTARLSQLITDLLDASRMESHGLHLRIDAFSPELLLRQLCDQVNLTAEYKGLALVTELDPDLPKTLYGDPNRLLLILNNLTANAIKFTQQGSVHVRLFQAGPDQWAFSVTDTGEGIPVDALEHIFEPFWQGNDPATRDKGGVGLGLSIVQQLVQLMDGHIQVESTVGVGSTFRVTLPLDLSLQRGE